MSTADPFDAVLIVAFGGPGGPDDVRPFLANVLRGRRVPPERIEEVAANYDLFGGVSPLTEITMRQAAGLRDGLTAAGAQLPVYVGMRNWRPYLADTLAEMSRAGVRRAIGFIAAAHHSYSSCQQYKENVRDARKEIVARGLADVEVAYVDSWFDHPLFIETMRRHTTLSLAKLPPDLQAAARIVFTAHSLPLRLARSCAYEQQLHRSCSLVMEKLGRADFALVYQSRSGMPSDPWLEPDIRDYLRSEKSLGLSAAVVVPIGFVCDHVEVLFDLDVQAADLCREIDLPMVRAATAGDDPLFVDMITDVVLATRRRFIDHPPLPITACLRH